MDVTSTTILTAIGGSHQKTEIKINWRGITESQLIALAQRAVISAIQQDYKSNGSCPEKDTVEAEWFVDRSIPSPIRKQKKISELPEYLRGKPDKEERSQKVAIDSAITGLTKEEREAIIILLQMK